MPTVEIRNFTGNIMEGEVIPHTFLVVKGDDGVAHAYGFYPEVTGLFGAGEVRDDGLHAYNSSSGEVAITEQQYQNLQNYIQNSIDNPQPYALPFGSQCTDWALTALTESDILPKSLFGPNMQPDNILQDFLENLYWNPYILGEIFDLRNIFGEVSNFFQNAFNWTPPRRDPLTLDLNGNGIETLAANGQVLFDQNADGIKEGTGWIAPNDGILVLDRNGNGVIDNGRELFGENTIKANGQLATNGFDALKDFDTNADGKFDAADAQWSQVKIWKDANSDGISQANELISLNTVNGVGIKQINLANTAGSVNVGNGNIATANGTFVWNDGHSGAAESIAANLNLASNPFYREFTDTVAIPENKLDLVDMQGSGAVRDLREAAVQSSALESTLRQYMAATTRDAQMAVLDKLLEDWAKSNTLMKDWVDRINATEINANQSGAKIDVEFRITTTKDYGSANVINTPWSLGDGSGTNAFASFDTINATNASKVYSGDALRVGRFADDPRLQALAKLRVLEIFNHQAFFNFDFARKDTNNDGISDQTTGTLRSGSLLRNVSLTDAAFVSSAGGGSNAGGELFGTVPLVISDDSLLLDNGQIAFIDQAYEQLRQSVYQGLLLQTRLKPYLDQVELTFSETSGFVLDFSAMDAMCEVNKATNAKAAFYDLIDLHFATGKQLIDQGWNGLSQLRSWTEQATGNAELQAVLTDMHVRIVTGSFNGTTGADILFGQASSDGLSGGDGNDIIDAAAGNDYLYGNDGNDLLIGREGSDYVYGGAGSDILDGGVGNDQLSGDAGNDVYKFGRGSGADTVYNYDATAGSVDTILLGAGLSPVDVTLSRYGDDLILSINGTNDTLTVSNYFYGDASDGTGYYRVEQIKFADGTAWDVSVVKSKVIVGTDSGQNLYGYANADTLMALGGNDYVYGNAGSDVLEGGAGNDALYAGNDDDTVSGGADNDSVYGDAGNDIVRGDAGNDYVYGGAGNDVLDGGAGNDYLSGDAGNDTYKFGRGAGSDTIYNYDTAAGGVDIIQLGSGVLVGDVSVSRYGDDLMLVINGTNDTLTVTNYFYGDASDATGYYRVDQIQFADGTVWDVATIKTKLLAGGTPGNDALYGYATNDTLNGGDGNDTLTGNAGSDVLTGGAGADGLYGGADDDTLKGGTGNDYLYGGIGNDLLQGNEHNDVLSGEEGSDTLDGGSGDDQLQGGNGADVYLFGKGSGTDTLYNHDYDVAGTNADTILLGAGITTTGITLRRESDDLVIRINGTDDTLRVQSYFYADGTGAYAVENLKFANGTVWDVATIKTKLLAGATTGNDALYGYATNDTLNGGDGNDTLTGNAGSDVLTGGAGADGLYGGADDDTLKGGTGNDYVYGGTGNDLLQGNEHNDVLYGDDGNDTLDGGSGNDQLQGGNGADVYLFGKGAGTDSLYNYDYDAAGTNADTILLGTGITTTGITLRRESDDLIIQINGTDDSLRVQSYFNSDGAAPYAVDNLKFADGTVWDIATIKTKVAAGATAGNDTLHGYATNDTLNGGDGNDALYGNGGMDVLSGGMGADWLYGGADNDTLSAGTGSDYVYGGAGNDVLQGNEHNDVLYGEDGNDTLDGGSGNDQLQGGNGADVYLFGKGSGADTIYNYDYDYDAAGTNADTILLGAGIATTGITLRREYDDLIIQINGTDDSLRVQSYFNSDGAVPYTVENLKFADGTVWNYAKVKTSLSMAALTSVTLSGTAGNDVLQGQAGDDRLLGQYGDDTLDGGLGSDALDGGYGNDVYLFGKGSGKDTIAAYDPTAGKIDKLVLGTGITTSGVRLQREGDTLVVSIVGTNDVLRVSNHFYAAAGSETPYGYQIDQIQFADGTVWDASTIKSKVLVTTNDNDSLIGYATADTLSALSGDDWVYGRGGNDTLDGGAGEDRLYGEDDNDLLKGGTQNDTLDGGSGNDVLQGQDGDDRLLGQYGDDTLDGGLGSDALDGGYGNDTYLFGKGSGKDGISAYDGTVGKVDTLLLGAGITTTGVKLQREGDTLVVSIVGTADVLRVNNHFYAAAGSETPYGYQIDQIQFADGTVWDASTIKSKVLIATNDNDTLIGYAAADTLSALSGDDWVYGRGGNDTLDGGAGEDRLYGEDGDDLLKGGTQNDTLDGGYGNDVLQGQDGDDRLLGQYGDDTLDGGLGNDALDGGYGNDTYLFGKGSGKDSVSAYDGTVGKVDTLLLGAGITTSGVRLQREGDTLVVSIVGTADVLRVNSHFYAAAGSDTPYGYQIDQIKFADGTVWDAGIIKSKVLVATNDNDTLIGYGAADTLSALSGDDWVYGRSGNDTLDGGAGEDRLYGEDDNDLLKGGTQNDTLDGGSGNDVLQGQDGDDRLLGQYGDDTLDGGLGNDALDGGYGNDVYLFGKGSGKDGISAYDGTVGKVDTLLLGAGITTSSVRLQREGDTLVVSIVGTPDVLRVNNHFYAAAGSDTPYGYQIEQIRFADGTIWDATIIKSKVQTATNDNDVLIGYTGADTLSALLGDDMVHGGWGNDTLDGGAGEDRLYGEEGDDLLKGGAQNDTLDGGAGNDVLQGQDGDDRLLGQYGDDTLDGGLGNDALDSGYGNDVYLFGKGSGKDTIAAYDPTAGKIDKLVLGAGITPSGVRLQREGDTLVVSIVGTNDVLRVSNHFYAAAGSDTPYGYQIDQIQFADGTVWDASTIKSKVLVATNDNDTLIGYVAVDTLSALSGDDAVSGRGGNDTLDGGAGEDRLYGEDGNDLLKGGAQNDLLDGGNDADVLQGQDGDDRLYGQQGDDTLDGGLGNDTLDGGYGNDTYLFGKGSGVDMISSYDATVGKVDVIRLGANVLVSDVTLSRSSNDLIVTINGTTDKLTVSNYFYNDASDAGYRVDKLEFAGGAVWDVATIKAKALLGNDSAQTITGYATADAINALGGNDYVYGRAGNDVIDGGAGSDYLQGEEGNDVLSGGADNDNLYGGADNDTLDGGAGNDYLIGDAGNDVYKFGRGSGQDTIGNYDATVGAVDALLVGNAVANDQLWFRRVGGDLQVSIIGTDDKVSITNWYSGAAYHTEQFKTADGKVLLDSQVENLVNAMAAFAPPSAGQTTLPQNYQDQLGSVIAANWQ